MPIDDARNNAARLAAARAAEEARRRAEEARERAEEAARKAAAAAAQKAQAAAQAAAKTKATALKKDEMSRGRGGALRRGAVAKLAAQGTSANLDKAPTGPTFKLSQLERMDARSFAAPALSPDDRQALRDSRPPPSSAPSTGDGYDQIEQVRAQRAQQQALDAATKGLPADKAQKVQQAARTVSAAANGISDPGQRAEATAKAIEQQSAQFKGDPASAQAFVQAIAPDVQSVGMGLSPAITIPLHGDSDKSTKPAIQSLAHAADNLGPGAALAMGKILAAGVPDAKDLMHFDDALKDNAGSLGGQALLFGVGEGFQAQGKSKSFGNLEGAMRDAMYDVSPGDVLTPVDPNDPDAAGKAQLKLDEARYAGAGMGSGDPNDLYASALKAQMDALKGNPDARHQVALSQTANIERLAAESPLTGWRLGTALDAAQAAGGGELQKLANAYADKLGQTNVDMREVASSVSPEAAKELAFAFARVGNTDMAGVFADRAAKMLNGVAGHAKDANDKVAELQHTLDQELAKVGPGLTPDQRHEYEAHYWDKHQDAIDEQKSANADLQGALNADLPALKQLAALSPDAAGSVAKCLKELARDPDQAKYVQDTVSGLRTNNAFPAGFAGAEKDLTDATSTATNTLANQKLAQGDAAGAVEELKHLQEFLHQTVFATKDLKEFVEKGLPALEKFTGLVADGARTHDMSKVVDFLQHDDSAKSLEEAGNIGGSLGKSLANITSAIGVAATIAGLADAKDGKAQLIGILHAGSSSAELLAKGFGAFSAATRDATNAVLKVGGEKLGELAGVLSKVAPVLNLGASVLEDVVAVGDAINDPNVKTIGAAVGDTMTAVGAAVAMFPGGQVIGGALAFAGEAVTLITGFIKGIQDDNARKSEEKDLLGGIYGEAAKDPKSPLYGLSDQQVKDAAARIANTGADLQKMAQDAGLSPDQLVRMAVATPVMGESYFRYMNDVARLSGLKGQAFVDWVNKQKDLDSKLMDWMSVQGMMDTQMSAAQQAGSECDQKQLYGEDRAKYYDQRVRELTDKWTREALKARGLVP